MKGYGTGYATFAQDLLAGRLRRGGRAAGSGRCGFHDHVLLAPVKPRTLDVLRTLGGMAVVLLAGLAFLEWSRNGRRVFVVPRIEAYDGRIEVVARMPDGQTPPSCAAVLYGPASMVPRPPIPMDATGRMSFDGLPRPATYAVQVTSAGQGPHEGYDQRRLVRVGSTGDAKAEVVFPVTRVAGTVIDATTGKPAPGAQVKAVRLIASKADDEVDLEHYFSSQGIESDETAPPLATTVADAEGGFRIEAVAPAFEIVGTGPDGSTGMELGLVRRGSAEHVTVFLMPTRPPLLEAGVIDENGHPIAGALLSPARGRKAVGDETATSDESGRFRLALGNAWQVRIEVAGSGAALASPPGRVAAATTFRFPRRTGLQVHVVEEATGAPLAGVEVHLFTPGTGGWPSAEIPCDGTAVTDADGLARLPAAPGITPRIMITAPGRRGGFLGADTMGTGPFALGKGSLSTPLSAGELRSIEIRMRHSTRVRGRVVSEERVARWRARGSACRLRASARVCPPPARAPTVASKSSTCSLPRSAPCSGRRSPPSSSRCSTGTWTPGPSSPERVRHPRTTWVIWSSSGLEPSRCAWSIPRDAP